MRSLCAALAILILTSNVRAADPDTRPAIDRGLKFLAADATSWKTDRQCASCHHASMAIWALNEAKTRGYTADDKAAAALAAWVTAKDDPAKVYPDQQKKTEIIANQAPLMLALGFEAGDPKEAASKDGLKRMLAAVLAGQRADGSWALLYEWQPVGSSPEVITTLALLALTSPNAPDLGADAKTSREKGLKWLDAQPVGESLQSAALRLVLLQRLGRPATEWQPLAKQVLAAQAKDGGWGQEKDMASDAYATGQALYALAEAGTKPDDPAVLKGQKFLVEAQKKDGSWAMASRPGGPGGKSAKNVAPITLAGTAWAVMGLARSSPPVAR